MKKNKYHNEIVWIIGASSGIGKALAKELSSRGAKLILSARRENELVDLNETLGNKHKVMSFDVADKAALTEIANEIKSSYNQIDRVIFLAAAYKPMKMNKLDIDTTKQIIDVNLLGAFYLIDVILPILEKQPHAQIALCGSVAGYIGLPSGQPYSATKAAIINLCESLHSELDKNIDVKLISPGFVRTPLTDKNEFDMPMIIEPKQAAMAIASGLLSKKFEIHFPKKFTIILKIIRILPYFLSLKITKKFR